MIDPYTGCPDAQLEPDDDMTYTHVCCVCGEPIAQYESYYDINDDTMHDYCVMDYVEQFKVVV